MTAARPKASATSGAPRRAPPRQERALQTYERLLDVAGELLGEVGIERISTNMICARAGMTPPALYRYFKDKYAVLEALGRRLMDRQDAAVFAWVDRYAPKGLDALAEAVEELLLENAAVTAREPGAIWTLRALRAVPQLTHVRLESLRRVTDRIAQAYAPLLPHLTQEQIWRRVRITTEFGYAVEDMLNEESLIPQADLIRDAAQMLRNALLIPAPPEK